MAARMDPEEMGARQLSDGSSLEVGRALILHPCARVDLESGHR